MKNRLLRWISENDCEELLANLRVKSLACIHDEELKGDRDEYN